MNIVTADTVCLWRVRRISNANLTSTIIFYYFVFYIMSILYIVYVMFVSCDKQCICHRVILFTSKKYGRVKLTVIITIFTQFHDIQHYHRNIQIRFGVWCGQSIY